MKLSKKNWLIAGIGAICIVAVVAVVIATTGTQKSSVPDIQPTAQAVEFSNGIVSDNYVVNGVSFKKLDGKTEITFDVTSKVDGHCSLFDPPSGDIYKVAKDDALKNGDNIIKFEIGDADLNQISELTLSLTANTFDSSSGGKQSCIFLATEQIGGIHKSGAPKSAPIKVAALEEYDDVRGGFNKPGDLSDISNISKKMLATLNFNEETIFPDKPKMPKDLTPEQLVEIAKNPGLGVRALHESGITGKGVNVAIIDQPLYQNHPEFEGKIVKYKEFEKKGSYSMHGPAVASLLVGDDIGTAPDANLYFAAITSAVADAKYYADALDWIIEESAALPEGEKIRVVSVSAAPSGPRSPFTQNNDMWDVSVKRATDAGILVLDCTSTYSIIGPAYFDVFDSDNPETLKSGFPLTDGKIDFSTRLLVPTGPRTVAEHYRQDEPSYQYCGEGGLSWAIPYASGVLAMGWEIRPEYTATQMTDLLFETAYIQNSEKFINPTAFIAALQAK